MNNKGAIVIDTKLNDGGIKKGWESLKGDAKKLVQEYNKSVDALDKQSVALDKLKNKLDLITSGNITPPSVKAMESQLKNADKEAQKLKATLDQMEGDIEMKGAGLDMTKSMYGEGSSHYQKEKADLDALIEENIKVGEKFEETTAKASSLREEVERIKLDPSSSIEAQDLANKIALASQKTEETKERTNSLKDKLGQLGKMSLKGLTGSMSGVKKGFDSIGQKIDKFKTKMTRLIGTAMVFSLIRKGLSNLAGDMGNLLNSNSQFASSLNQIKVNLMTAFAPIYNAVLPAINALMSALSSITGAIASFVASIFGQTAGQAKDNAKALYGQAKAYEKVGKSAKDASGKLASFDKLEVNEPKSGSDSGGGGSNPLDFSGEMKTDPKFLDFLNKCKEVLATLFEPFRKAWDSVGSQVIASMKNALNNVLGLLGDIGRTFLTVWDSNIGVSIATNIFLIWKDLFDMIGNLAGSFRKAWNEAGRGEKFMTALLKMVDSILGGVRSITKSFADLFATDVFQTGIALALDLFTDIFDIIGLIADAFANAWDEHGLEILQGFQTVINEILRLAGLVTDSIKQWVMSEGFQMALDTVLTVIKDIVGWIADLCTWIVDMYEKYVKPIIDEKIIPLINTLIEIIKTIWDNAVKPVIDWIVNALKFVLEPAIAVVSGLIGGIVDVVKWVADLVLKIIKGDIAGAFGMFGDIAQKAWNAITNVFGKVAEWFGNIFKKAWEGVKNVFSTGGKIFAGIVEGIANLFKNVVNAIISGINKVIAVPFNVINGMLNTIRNIGFLGIEPFKGLWKENPLPVPQIPKLATGTVAYAPLIAQIGEYAGARSNPEIVSPESLMRQVVREEAGGGSKEVVIENLTIISKIGEETLRRQVIKGVRLEEKLSGKSLFVS